MTTSATAILFGNGQINIPQEILDTLQPKTKGTCFYLDNILYMDNVPFIHAEGIRDVLLRERTDGTLWFDILKIVDPSGNETKFYPSKRAQRVHKEKVG